MVWCDDSSLILGPIYQLHLLLFVCILEKTIIKLFKLQHMIKTEEASLKDPHVQHGSLDLHTDFTYHIWAHLRPLPKYQFTLFIDIVHPSRQLLRQTVRSRSGLVQQALTISCAIKKYKLNDLKKKRGKTKDIDKRRTHSVHLEMSFFTVHFLISLLVSVYIQSVICNWRDLKRWGHMYNFG